MFKSVVKQMPSYLSALLCTYGSGKQTFCSVCSLPMETRVLPISHCSAGLFLNVSSIYLIVHLVAISTHALSSEGRLWRLLQVSTWATDGHVKTSCLAVYVQKRLMKLSFYQFVVLLPLEGKRTITKAYLQITTTAVCCLHFYSAYLRPTS